MNFLRLFLINVLLYVCANGVLIANSYQNESFEAKKSYKYPKTVRVKGVYKKNGTYVAPHWRSPPRRR